MRVGANSRLGAYSNKYGIHFFGGICVRLEKIFFPGRDRKLTSLFLSTNMMAVISFENQQFQTVIGEFLFNLSTRDLWR